MLCLLLPLAGAGYDATSDDGNTRRTPEAVGGNLLHYS